MSKRPKIKQEDGTLVDLPLDAETLQGKTLEEIALKTDIPTKTSELENDNGYAYFKTGINGYNVTEQWSNRSNYEFTLLEDGYYKATTENYGDMRFRSFVMCKVEFEVENECDVVIDYYANSYKNKIFSIFSKLDTTLSQSYETTEDVDNIYHETSYIGISTMQGDSPNKIVYHNVSTGLHYIYVKLLNNSDNTFGGFDFKFKINEEETNSKLKKIITNGNNTIDISQFENCLKFKPLITNYNVINSGTNSNLIFSLTSDGYYKSEHEFEFRDATLISQGFVMCKVEFEVENECDVIIDIPNGNGGYYESSIGAIFSKLDATLSKSYETTEDTDNIYQEVRESSVKNVTYYNVSKGLHYIYIKLINSDEETGFTSYFKFKINEKSFKDINYITDETHHIDLEEIKTEINNNLEELREDINNDLSKKQDKLQVGANITIDNNVISAKDTIVEFEKVDELPELTPELAKEKEHTVYSHDGSLYNILYNVGGYQEPLYLKDTYSVLPHKTNGGGCALVGTDIYIFGGYSYDENGAFTDYSIRKFDTINKTVTVLDVEIPDDINSGYGFEDCPVVAIGTDIYIFLKIDSGNTSCYKFDTVNETLVEYPLWSEEPISLNGVNTCTVDNNNILWFVDTYGYINYWDIQRNANEIHFDASTTVSDDEDIGGCLVKSVGNHLYIFGGLSSNKIIKYNTIDAAREIVGEFSEFESIYDMSGVVFGTDIYIMGGEYNNKMYKFDTLTDTLTELDITLPTEHNKDGCAIAINNHEFFLIGGDIGSDEKTNNIYHYSLTEDSEGAILEYQQLTGGGSGGVSEEDVLQIIEDNSSNVDTSISIGTSADYDPSSDTQIPTTKAVQDMINVGGGSGGSREPKLVATATRITTETNTSFCEYSLSNNLTLNKLYLVKRFFDGLAITTTAVVMCDYSTSILVAHSENDTYIVGMLYLDDVTMSITCNEPFYHDELDRVEIYEL
jgi:hypothetical protein